MKVNIDEILNDCVSIQNQIDGLNMLLIQKKQKIAKYFDTSGKRQLSNEDCVVYLNEKTTIDYDVVALTEKLEKDVYNFFIDKEYTIKNWNSFVKFLKSKKISGNEISPYILVKKSINKEKLSKLYDDKKITLDDIDGCYNAKVTKSIVLRLKNAEREINVK